MTNNEVFRSKSFDNAEIFAVIFYAFLTDKKRQRLIAKLVVTSLTHKRIEMKFYFLREAILTSFVVEIYLK